jgi:ADP-heptose:LPS heptosyltransferase
LTDPFGGDPPKKPQSVLFLKLAEQGSTVLAYEAIRSATERVGPRNVYFLVFVENRFILDLLKLIPEENVLAINTKSPLTMVASFFRQLVRIWSLKIDACIDMEFFARSTAVIAFLTGCPIRVGFHAFFGEGPSRGNLFTHRMLYNAHLHASSTFASLVLALDNKPEDFPTFAVAPTKSVAPPQFEAGREIDRVDAILAECGVARGKKIVLLNANASDLLPLRRWDPANYVELAKRLLHEFPDVVVGFTGAPNEAAKVAALVECVGSPRAVCLAGRTTLRQLLIAYNRAELLVTNDSGPAHFATLTMIDVIALFGPETPLLFGAPSPRNHSLWAGIACSPCVNALNNRQTACKNNLCMQRLPVDQVFTTASQVLRARIDKQTTARRETRQPENQAPSSPDGRPNAIRSLPGVQSDQ